ncbi:MAG: murein transglycosylase A [Deltaproteobacteria bacterium]|nr:murein transglycosylase A [Deltaproteobacteria bacterium]
MLRRSVWLVALLCLLVGCATPARKPPARPSPKPAVVKPVLPPERPSPPPAAVEPGIPAPPVPPKTIAPLTLVPDDHLPFFDDDMDRESLEVAIEKSLQYYRRAAARAPVWTGTGSVTVADLQDSLIALREILRNSDTAEARQSRIRETFDVYQSAGDGRNGVLFTGYFESKLKGSLTKTDEYRYPIYRVPDDAVTVNLGKFRERYKSEQLVGRVKNGELIPYYSRSEIDQQGVLSGRNLEIVWVNDRIDLFFMHTQGSGKIELTDGSLLQVGYAAKNGRPFQSVGNYMLKEGKIAPEQLSYREIKKYLREHPDELTEILGYNESYIFFRIVEGGPVGAIGEILTPGRSIATDPDFFPKGALAFIRMRKPIMDPDGNVKFWVPYTRFVVNQDAGGAIKGAGRVDLFCGYGPEAEMVAGSLKEAGQLYFLVKKRANGSTDQRNARK